MTQGKSTASERADNAQLRKEGRAFVVALHGASRATKLYPLDHQSVQRAAADVMHLAEDIRERDQEFDCRVQGEFLFINGTRLRLELGNYASFANVLSLFRDSDVGGVRVVRPTTQRDWVMLISLLGTPSDALIDERYDALSARLLGAGIVAFELSQPTQGDGTDSSDMEVQAAAKRTYMQSVAITKDVINSIRMGRAPSLKRLKRAVQGVIDHVLNEETSLIGLTTLRDYDEYTYTHCVNVCIFAIALGKRMGMTKVQLYELGLAALLHDIGKTRLPSDVLLKAGALTEDEWQLMTQHPWLGMIALCQLRGAQEFPYRAVLAAHEHHMKCDLTGYPRVSRPRTLSIISRIVAVVDSYDAGTSMRSYQQTPYPPAAVLQEMRDNPRRGLDVIVVKAFINLLGIYPAGTLVVLDTFELAVVRSANPDPSMLSRPLITVVSDQSGNLLDPPLQLDLAIRAPSGQFARTIIKTADPDSYGIRVSDYLM